TNGRHSNLENPRFHPHRCGRIPSPTMGGGFGRNRSTAFSARDRNGFAHPLESSLSGYETSSPPLSRPSGHQVAAHFRKDRPLPLSTHSHRHRLSKRIRSGVVPPCDPWGETSRKFP